MKYATYKKKPTKYQKKQRDIEKVVFISIVTAFMLANILYSVIINSKVEDVIVEVESIKQEMTIEDIKIITPDKVTTFTAFTLSEDETDSEPCIGAANNNLCELKPLLKEKGISICASRDLPLDTEIYITGIGMCKILDRMNERYLGTDRIDILMDSKQEAFRFGLRELSYVIIK